jgi:hypothetical protein
MIKGKSGKWQAITNLDAFPHAEDHLTQKTSSGAAGTILRHNFWRRQSMLSFASVYAAALGAVSCEARCFWLVVLQTVANE